MFRLFAVLRGHTPRALVRAALEGHASKVEELLGAGVPIDGRDETGGNALMAAATRGHAEVVQVLVQRGAQVDAIAPNGSTALSMAAHAGDPTCVERLLDAGADPNAGSLSGVTPLMLAAKAGSLPAVRTLLAAGADVRCAVRASVPMREAPGDIYGFTAMAFAVLRGHAEVVRTLKAHGARLDPCLPGGFTLLTLATVTDGEAAARMLLNLGVDPNAPIRVGPRQGQTAMAIAVERDNRDLISLLASYGAETTGVRVKVASATMPPSYRAHQELRRTG